MLTGEIRNQVDRIWDAFWTGGISNPLEVEQLTHLLFIKRLDELHTLEERKANRLGTHAEKERARTEQSFMVSKDEIAGNGYDLSINRYKEVAYTETAYDPPAVILDELDALEREIQEGLEELRGMLAETERDDALHLETSG